MNDSNAVSAAVSILSVETIGVRTQQILQAAYDGKISGLRIYPERLQTAVDWASAEIEKNHPDHQIPPLGCWRQFEAGAMDRWGMLAGARGFQSAEEMLRSAGDLAVLSAVMDVALRPEWTFVEPISGHAFDGALGRALAALTMFAAGTFSAEPDDPLRVDAHALIRLEEAEIAAGLQLSESEDSSEISQLTALLRRLGETIGLRPDLFELKDEVRPGCLLQNLSTQSTDGVLHAPDIVEGLLDGLSPLWQGGAMLDEVILGDTWRHTSSMQAITASDLVPFHLPTLAIFYSFIEPLAWVGLSVGDLEAIPGLANLEHAALFLACGAVEFETDTPETSEKQAVELRAITLGLLSELAKRLRSELDADETSLPLTCVQEGGTLPAGRAIARENPEAWRKASKILGDGGVFWLPFRA
ncbi:DUF1688 family protein [Roseibium polysiphoniae]|uniref:DUF1688 family protein n=1 Tax=Roseibium polysiphoniae TaxID=2571221 RepID=A0A944CG92_9HYPH|nr:DUF1688 family protein [Roseibium polysiphoniae]MBS8262484.1 DUF1688 family protein [Roseibium polysiphoniae]